MKKLCKQNPLAFSLVWIGIYVVAMSALDELSRALGRENLLTALFAPVLCVGLFLFLRKNGLLQTFGLCRGKLPKLWYIPLFLLTTGNLWGGVAVTAAPADIALFAVKMLCVGFLEELIFRGFLFRAMEKESVKWAVLVSSLTFGLGHIVNLFNGSQMGLTENLVQIVCAMAVGFLYVAIFIRGGSLWPCILSHGLFNVTSAFAKTQQSLLVSALLCLLALTCGGMLLKQKKTGS